MTIHRFDEIDSLPIEKVGDFLELNCEKHFTSIVNWPNESSYQPLCAFAMAYSKTNLYLQFVVRGNDLRAVNSANLSPVADDSCVEFFMQLPSSSEYWNFEFNCIGAVNASHRVERPKATRLNDTEIASIRRYASCGSQPFEEKSGVFSWTLTVAIPFDLLGVGINLPSHIMGNFYKCGAKTSHPHYLSWSPINLEKPNFHCPQFFGKIILD